MALTINNGRGPTDGRWTRRATALSLTLMLIGAVTWEAGHPDAAGAATIPAQVSPSSPSEPKPDEPYIPRDLAPGDTPKGGVTGAPAIRCAQTAYDFGTHWAGPTLEYAFVIRNGGDQLLKIVAVRPSCGCTVAKGYDQTIAPGREGRIPIVLDTKKISGKFTKSISVESNDPVTPALRLRVSGHVRQLLSKSPKQLSFGRIRRHDPPVEQVMTVTNNTEKPVNLRLEPPSIDGPFSAQLVEKEPGKVFELRVKPRPDHLRQRRNREKLVVLTDLPELPRFEVPVLALVPPRLDARPNPLVLIEGGATQLSRQVRFDNNGPGPVRLTSAAAEDRRLQTKVTEREAGRHYSVELTVPAQYRLPDEGTRLVLLTDDPSQPELRIPIVSVETVRRERVARRLEGYRAPRATFVPVEGSHLLTGGPVDGVLVLDFVQSADQGCLAQLRELRQLYETRYAKNPRVRFVVVALDKVTVEASARPGPTPASNVADRLAETIGSLELMFDSHGDGRRRFLAHEVPLLALVGPEGKIEALHIGSRGDWSSLLATQIDLLLAGKTRADFPEVSNQDSAEEQRSD